MIEPRLGLSVILTLCVLFSPLAGQAQQAGRVPRIGVLSQLSPEGSPYDHALRDGLRERGYIEGQNITVEWRWARGRPELFPVLIAELLGLKPDVIVAANNGVVAAAQKATRTIPIVMVIVSDPVGLGFVASLGQPNSNITGTSTQSPELAGKRLQLLKEVVPNLARLAILWNPAEPGRQGQANEAADAARRFGVQTLLFAAKTPNDLDSAFAAARRADVSAIFPVGDTMQGEQRVRMAALALQHRLPMLCSARSFVEAGCLMTYGVDFRDLWRRAGYFVDRILKGAKPADLPVEQPTTFELVINSKTARALGLTIPQSLLRRADHVVE